VYKIKVRNISEDFLTVFALSFSVLGFSSVSCSFCLEPLTYYFRFIIVKVLHGLVCKRPRFLLVFSFKYRL
jgi:hypothetical protein